MLYPFSSLLLVFSLLSTSLLLGDQVTKFWLFPPHFADFIQLPIRVPLFTYQHLGECHVLFIANVSLKSMAISASSYCVAHLHHATVAPSPPCTTIWPKLMLRSSINRLRHLPPAYRRRCASRLDSLCNAMRGCVVLYVPLYVILKSSERCAVQYEMVESTTPLRENQQI